MSNWKVGDRAILVNDGRCATDCLMYMGSECLIVSVCDADLYDWDVDVGAEYFLEVRNSGIRPIPDDKSTWEELEKIIDWNPTKVLA